MDPVLFRSGQYLQSYLLQNDKPLSLFGVPTLEVLAFATVVVDFDRGCGAVLSTLVEGCSVTLLKKSVIDFCRFPCCGAGSMVSAGGAWIPVCSGSAISSPILGGTLARTRMSRRFLGLLYPHINDFVCKSSVVGLRPSISQFWNIIRLRWRSCG